jgi:hypothetical protein
MADDGLRTVIQESRRATAGGGPTLGLAECKFHPLLQDIHGIIAGVRSGGKDRKAVAPLPHGRDNQRF